MGSSDKIGEMVCFAAAPDKLSGEGGRESETPEEAPKALVGVHLKRSREDPGGCEVKRQRHAGSNGSATQKANRKAADSLITHFDDVLPVKPPRAPLPATVPVPRRAAAVNVKGSRRRVSLTEQQNHRIILFAASIISALPPHADAVKSQKESLSSRRAPLPPSPHGLPTLVLDLDETLVHCTVDPIENADHVFPVVTGGQQCAVVDVYMRIRPDLHRFLNTVKDMYEIVVFTASERAYADKVLDLVDPAGKFFAHRLYREDCLNIGGNYIKDLSSLGRDLSRTTLVDNSPYAFGYQLSNGIPISTWVGDYADQSLMALVPLLTRLAELDDLRPLLANTFQMHNFVSLASSLLPLPKAGGAQQQQQRWTKKFLLRPPSMSRVIVSSGEHEDY